MATARKHKFYYQRAKRVAALSFQLWKALIEPDGGHHVTLTGSIVSSTTLRSKKSKEQFALIAKAATFEDDLENDQSKGNKT